MKIQKIVKNIKFSKYKFANIQMSQYKFSKYKYCKHYKIFNMRERKKLNAKLWKFTIIPIQNCQTIKSGKYTIFSMQNLQNRMTTNF